MLQADGRTDIQAGMTKLKVACRYFANKSKNRSKFELVFSRIQRKGATKQHVYTQQDNMYTHNKTTYIRTKR